MAVTRIHCLILVSQLPFAHSDAKRTPACPFHFDHGSQKKHCPTVQRQAVCFDISTSVCDRRVRCPQTMCPPPRDSVLAFLGQRAGERATDPRPRQHRGGKLSIRRAHGDGEDTLFWGQDSCPPPQPSRLTGNLNSCSIHSLPASIHEHKLNYI